MKFAKLFHIFKDETLSSEDQFIFLEDFLAVLKKTDKTLRNFNLKRSLQRYEGGIRVLGEKDVVPVSSVLQYCFQQLSSSEGCSKIAKQVEKELLSDKTEDNLCYVSSSLELYKLISKTKFHDASILFNNVKIDESKIITLIIDHKCDFSIEDWRKICWFESHFAKSLDNIFHELDYEEVLRLKYSKFQLLLNFKECCQNWLSVSRQQIKDKTNRYDTAEKLNQVEIVASKRHIPSVIDNEVKSQIQVYSQKSIQHAVCFDVGKSASSNKIQLVIGFLEQFDDKTEDLCKNIFFTIKRKHSVLIEKIFFLDETTLQNFITEGSVSRFHLRDAIENITLDGIIHVWNGESLCDETETSDESEVCETCFSVSLVKPLSIDNFDIIQEWYLEIPTETQLLLETFMNRDSLRRSKNPEKLFQQKLEKLYAVYDVLLNVYNRNFTGIFTQANTSELLIDYKAIKSVFDVTSSSGVTTSLSAAESKLKTKANDDVLYFNTYLKQHPLHYKTIANGSGTKINIRQCHVILMLDNLVRWRGVANPTPGVKSNQMCTLPITLQGLPLDSAITEEWHLPECDGSFQCVCKKEVQLRATDIKDLLLEPQHNEEKVYNQFFRLMTWGNTQLWNSIPGKKKFELTILSMP